MGTALRVSLNSSLKQDALTAQPAPALLDLRGPLVCLGGAAGADGLAQPVKPDRATLFGPRGACLVAKGGPLWVSDTGHHRLLGWSRVPLDDHAPADWMIGQPDAFHEGRNAKGAPGAATLNVPTGITACGDGIAVADAWNHRVLIWHALPQRDNVPADVVLGQADFATMESNRGASAPSANTLFWPYGVHWDGSRLWVADAGNRRLLMWTDIPARNGQPAALVLGQRDFHCRDENGGGAPTSRSMRWPHAIAVWNGRLCLADAGNNRIMVWDRAPATNNRPCDHMLGQNDAELVDNNQSLYWPSAGSVNMPYGIAAADDWLLAADTANSRLLGWHGPGCTTGDDASAVAGQPDFHAKGDNRWLPPARDSLCWPYGIAHCAGTVVVSDSGNNRILLWQLAAANMRDE